jgi:hypothetical protein
MYFPTATRSLASTLSCGRVWEPSSYAKAPLKVKCGFD